MIPSIPQVVEKETPQTQDAFRECLLYDEFVICVFLTDTLTEEHSASGPLLFDRNLQSLAKRNA